MEGKEYFFDSVCMDFECLLKEKEEDFANRKSYCLRLRNLCGCVVLQTYSRERTDTFF